MPYKVKDIKLAPQGVKKIEWVQKHMPVLETIKKHFKKEKPFEGLTIGSCLHLEPKTINLGLTLQAGGAEVAMTGCNPLNLVWQRLADLNIRNRDKAVSMQNSLNRNSNP
jgi:adenosylhomocysteinase